MSEPDPKAEMTELVEWMRERGVLELETPAGYRVKLGAAPQPLTEQPLDTTAPEEATLERKRKRYESLLGRHVTAEEARDHLP